MRRATRRESGTDLLVSSWSRCYEANEVEIYEMVDYALRRRYGHLKDSQGMTWVGRMA